MRGRVGKGRGFHLGQGLWVLFGFVLVERKPTKNTLLCNLGENVNNITE